jgi:NAD dependent epimerase/dehydratase family enzyme
MLPTPASALRLAMGEMATIALDGQRVLPQVAVGAGYRFVYEDLAAAVRAELAPGAAAA